MMRNRLLVKVGAIALAGCLAGCQSFRRSDIAQPPPKPAPGLNIPNPPSTARENFDSQVKPVEFVPHREAPAAEPMPQVIEAPLRVLYQRAAQRYAGMDTYVFDVKQREVVNGKKQPEEHVRVHVRREPYSVRLIWLNEASKGRELIYVQGKFGNKMQILMSPNDGPILFGRRHNFALDDPIVRDKSRYSITETGFASLIERFGHLVVAAEKNDPRVGSVKYLGRMNRPEFRAQVECVHQVIPPGSDRLFPKGGQRWWFFDVASGLPVLIIAHDPSGEVEYYCCDSVRSAALDERDFDPDRAWRK